jgi:hypothetical protein
MFEPILSLRKKLPPERLLEVTHGDYTWTARFEWQPPLKDLLMPEELGKSLPRDFLTFLKEVANGCILYYDAIYGQWGYKIYRVEELESKQDLWQLSLGEKWRNEFVAFAELYGEANVLLFDLSLPTADSSSFTIREGNPNDVAEDWPIVSRSFHEWLDHLITAQGAKYWEWK